MITNKTSELLYFLQQMETAAFRDNMRDPYLALIQESEQFYGQIFIESPKYDCFIFGLLQTLVVIIRNQLKVSHNFSFPAILKCRFYRISYLVCLHQKIKIVRVNQNPKIATL